MRCLILFNEEEGRIEAHYVCRRRTVLEDDVVLEAGERILIGFSYKFDYAELNAMVDQFGFARELEMLDVRNNHVLLILKK